MSDKTPPTLAERGIVTREQLATQLNKKVATIRLWEKRGMPVIKYGRTRLYDIADIVDWMKKQSNKAA